MSDGTDTIAYAYDADGHRTDVYYPDGTSTSADYNDKGQLLSTTDVTGAVTSYVYDATDGTLTSATQRRGSTVLASVAYTYDALSRIATTTRGNGTVTTNTYTAQNQLATQTTKDAAGRVIEAHSYTYDAHYNPATRTDTYAPGGSASPTGGTWTTVYSYDAYDRLIGSAVHTGPLTNGQPNGLPVTTTQYTVDLGGDVVATKKTTRLGGIRPITTTTTSTNTIDDSGRLTARKTGSATATQTFDEEGRVLASLDGVTTTYMTDGSPATTTLPDDTTTAYELWPDGTRRSATTAHPDGGTSTVTYHYGVDGVVLNDSTNDTSTPAGTATTASYLVTAGREARTLLAGTAVSGLVTGTPAAPIDTGTGVGYYLRDRHTSVTGMVDDSGAVTGTYAYSDYGTPARADGRPVNLGAFDSGRTNPYTYLGASPRGPWTEAGSGLLAFDDRTYDPRQGRFTSPDPVDAHNRYQAFNTNPITYLDLSGQMSTTDIVLEAVFAVVMLATAILTAGAALAAAGAIVGAVEVGAEVTASVVVNLAANAIGTAANLTAGISGSVLTVSDTIQATGGKNFLSDDQRNTVNLVNNVATAVAGVTGVVGGFTDGAAEAVSDATKLGPTAPDYIPDGPPLGPDLPPDWNPDAVNAADQVQPPQAEVPPEQQLNGGDPPANEQPVNPNPEMIENGEEPMDPSWKGVRPPSDDPPPPNLNPDALPGQEVLNDADKQNIGLDSTVQLGTSGAKLAEKATEPPPSDPVPVRTSDPITTEKTSPDPPHLEPGASGSSQSFDHHNVTTILLN